MSNVKPLACNAPRLKTIKLKRTSPKLDTPAAKNIPGLPPAPFMLTRNLHAMQTSGPFWTESTP